MGVKVKWLLSICLVMWTTSFSMAAEANKGDGKRATAEFKKGIKLYKNGKMNDAVQAFRRADALKPSWKIQYNIGQCEAALKRYGLAIEAFEQYLGQGGDDVPVGRRDEVLQELDRLRRMVGTIIVKGEPGVDVYVDIVKHGNTSTRSSIKVTAGVEHQVSFMKNGQKLGTVTLVVSGGEVVEIPVGTQKQPAPVTVAAPAPAAPAAPAARPAAAPAPATPPPVAKPKPYSTMMEIKQALRKGTITRQQYAQYQTQIRKNLNAEYDALKRDLRARKITKHEYKLKMAAVKRKYEGH